MVSILYFHSCNYNHYILQSPLYRNLFLLDVGNVAVSLHLSGSSSLNSNPECALLMENVMVNICDDYYTVMFIFNRYLYSEFVFT